MGPCQAPLALITDGQQRAGPDAIQRGLAVAQAQEAHHLRGSDALPQQLPSHHKARLQSLELKLSRIGRRLPQPCPNHRILVRLERGGRCTGHLHRIEQGLLGLRAQPRKYTIRHSAFAALGCRCLPHR
jgi:hypothetical protein